MNRVPWENHPAKAGSGITNGSPIINFNGFTVGPDGSIPQVIKQFNDSFRDDFTFTVNKGGRHDLKVGRGIHQELLAAHDLPDLLGHLLRAGRRCADSVSGGDAGDLPGRGTTPTPGTTMRSTPTSRSTRWVSATFNFAVDRHVFAGWLQDDWKIKQKTTLNLGLRYDLALNAFGEKFALEPWLEGNRPNDKNNVGPRVGFAYQLNDRTVLRGGFGKYYSEVTDMSAHGTISWQNIVILQVNNDGRADFGSNPLNLAKGAPYPTL